MDIKEKIYNKVLSLSGLKEPFMDIEGNHYAIYRGVKIVNTGERLHVYNATKKNFIEIHDIDSLKIIFAFIEDEDFNIGKHMQERWTILEKELRSKKKIIINLKQKRQKQIIINNQPNLFNT